MPSRRPCAAEKRERRDENSGTRAQLGGRRGDGHSRAARPFGARTRATKSACWRGRPLRTCLPGSRSSTGRSATIFAALIADGSGAKSWSAQLREEKFDVAMLLQNAFDAAWLAWRAGIPERIGYARDARGPLLTQAIPVPGEDEIPRHESYYYLELLRRAGWAGAVGSELPPVRLQIPGEARDAAESRLRSAGSAPDAWRCAIAPGASYGAAKCWPPERFAQVADRLISECGADVIFFGTPEEKEIAAQDSFADEVARDFSGRRNFHARAGGAVFPLLGIHRQRFRSHARGGRGGNSR